MPYLSQHIPIICPLRNVVQCRWWYSYSLFYDWNLNYHSKSLNFIFIIFKFLFHYMCGMFGLWTVSLGQTVTESADWEGQNGRIFSNGYHWRPEWRPSFAQTFSFFVFMHQSFATSATQGPRNSWDFDFLSLKLAYMSCTTWEFFFVESPQIVPAPPKLFSLLLPRLYLAGNQKPAQPWHYYDNAKAKSKYLSLRSPRHFQPLGSRGCKWLVH